MDVFYIQDSSQLAWDHVFLQPLNPQKHIFYRVNVFTDEVEGFLEAWHSFAALWVGLEGAGEMVWDGSMMNDLCVRTDLCLS